MTDEEGGDPYGYPDPEHLPRPCHMVLTPCTALHPCRMFSSSSFIDPRPTITVFPIRMPRKSRRFYCPVHQRHRRRVRCSRPPRCPPNLPTREIVAIYTSTTDRHRHKSLSRCARRACQCRLEKEYPGNSPPGVHTGHSTLSRKSSAIVRHCNAALQILVVRSFYVLEEMG